MKKKLLLIFTLILTAIFGCCLQSKAYIGSEQDIQNKIVQVRELSQFNFLSLINKNELVGYRLDDFRMSSQFYANSIVVVADNLNNILNQIELIKNSSDLTDTEKNMRIRQLYQDADAALYDVDTKTINYLIDIRRPMPTITYDKYIKKFQQYYNGLNLTNSSLNVY